MAWAVFATGNIYLTFVLPGAETIPYHLVWASFALLYGLYPWPLRAAWTAFALITVATGTAFVSHALDQVIPWSECSEIVLMGVILALLMWHVERQRATRRTLLDVQAQERTWAQRRETTARFGTHEVRTRLAIARGFVELMGSSTSDSGMRSDAALVLGELDKASAIVSGLLTLATVGEPSSRVSFSLRDLLDSISRRWVSSADREFSTDSSIGEIEGDPERLEAALDCLIENAVKFTEPGQAIDITARADRGILVVTVTDEGMGIPQDELGHVFEMFRTGSTAGRRAGSGLGLSIVKAMAESRRGSVSVTSTEGQGSRFTLRLPLIEGDTAIMAWESSAPPATLAARG
ncbi:sensor histidine kinase [Nakamurella panacisegetis]|uniref:sensor histidine kinase n=1 Tax=Nakamurella panacisegetis TaxID=1090615 RepID=UPI001E61038D|nr:HAMP domain-containing sensor histidine kinase [Nakamurella panacisegetis]